MISEGRFDQIEGLFQGNNKAENLDPAGQKN
jgi:hypothetical protein